jgi:hypothetical protein
MYAMIRDYSTNDREPYGSRIGMITARLNQIDQQLGTIQRRYDRVAAEVDRQDVSSAQTIVGAPFLWVNSYRAWRELKSIRTDLAGLEEAFKVVKESLRQLNSLAWEVALQVRRLQEDEEQLKGLIEGMSDRKVHGKSFETAISQEKKLRSALRRIPEYFFTAGQAELLQQADKETVSNIVDILTSVQPDLEKQFQQVREWDNLYLDTTNKVNAANQLLGELETLLDVMPQGLDLQPVKTRMKPMTEISKTLFATMSRLEVESLPEVAGEAERLSLAAKGMLETLRQARRHEGALERVTAELNAGLKTLSAQFASLAKNPVHPINWNLSREGVADLSRQIASLEPPEEGRELESVGADLTRANALLARQKELALHCQEAAGQHEELLQLLETAELKEGLTWSQGALDFASKVAVYDPENWPRPDAPGSLGRDLRELSERHQRVVAQDSSRPVLETELKTQLDNTRALCEQYKALHIRVDKVQTRYNEILEAEKLGRNRLQDARLALGHIDLLVRGIDFLNTAAGQEVDRLRKELEGISADLSQRQKGLVEAKAKAVSDLVTRLEGAANGWIDRLNADIEQKKKAIASILETLAEIGNLEERAVSQASELLRQDAQASGAYRLKQKSAFQLQDLVGGFKPRADYWQACVAVIRELGDLEKQVVDAYQNAAKNYQDMKDQLALAAQFAPEQRHWPPTSLTLGGELQEFNRIETQWETLETQPGRAIWVVRQLGDIAGKCQVVAERAKQIVQRASQERERVENLEDELEGLFRQWQEQGQLNPGAANQIRKLKQQTEGELDGLQRDYIQGRYSYQDVIHALSTIYRNLQGAQIRLEDGQILSLDGESRLSRWRT